MTVFLIVLGIVVVLAIGVALAVGAARADRALIARAEVQARQRKAEADVQHLVQDTIARMFDTARRQP